MIWDGAIAFLLISHSPELLLRKNGAIACSVYALGFRKCKGFRRVTEEGYSALRCYEVQ